MAMNAEIGGEGGPMMELDKMQREISDTCDEIKALLLAKNASYGNAVAKPINIFSKAEAVERVDVRIDDKLQRIAMGHEFGSDDTLLDLIGYLVIRRILVMKSTSLPKEVINAGS